LADILVSESTRTYTGYGLFLDRACKALAVVAGVTLVIMALMSLWSILGRSVFDKPLIGDYELVQMLSAVAVAMTLPYAHWVGAHVIVDFFTAKAPVKTNAFLDLLANVILAVFSAVISWRLALGMVDLKGNFDASMMLNIPTWWSYAPLVPSFALLAAAAAYAANDNLRKLLK
jgi:TRAP-type C4-dicarboxylate transport system permease small subunit